MAETMLLATNSKTFSEDVRNEFKHKYRIDVEKNVNDAIEYLSKRPGIALIDISIPDTKDRSIIDLALSMKLSQTLNYFLLSKTSDLKRIEKLQQSICLNHFLVRKNSKNDLKALSDVISKRLNPDNFRKIKLVRYIAEGDFFFVIFWNDKEYRLNRDCLIDIDDNSGISGIILDERSEYFNVIQASGEEYDVSWDFVLYHCEPEYEYYKGKQNKKESERRNLRIGGNIKRIRTEKGLTSYQLADITGIKRPNVSRLEAGKHSISMDSLERIADALKIPVSSLL